MTIKFFNTIPKEAEQKMRNGFVQYETLHNISVNYQPFSLIAYSHTSQIIGVLKAYTAFAEIYIEDLWVDAAYRQQNYGRKLLQTLENKFQDKGFNNINLVTSSFQAPEFYLKCGFTLEFTRYNKINPQLSKSFFIKYFDNPIQTQGVIKKIDQNTN